MSKINLLGNPNVGKSTLFNSLTKSNEHTGNFHGVTVEEKTKKIILNGKEFEIVDLPGIYSLNTFSFEEEISKNAILKKDGLVFVIVDAFSLRKNLYLCLQLLELDVDFKILINNYEDYKKVGSIDTGILSEGLGVEVEIINAKKCKPTLELLSIKKTSSKPDYYKNFVSSLSEKYGEKSENIILAINGDTKNINEKNKENLKSDREKFVGLRYEFIDEILSRSLTKKKDYVYGLSKFDKVLTNPLFMTVGFFLTFVFALYIIFFGVGKSLSELLGLGFSKLFINPLMNFISLTTDNVWIIDFFEDGFFASITTVLGFVPQVALLFIFLTILEDSGIIARLSYVADDFFTKLGLNGKSIYTMLLGLGCNSMACMACRNMSDKNLKIKTAILNPFVSCMARLPVFVLVASAFFNKFSFFVVAGLYLLGILIMLVFAFVLNKTILPTNETGLLLEFPPLRFIDFKHTLKEGLKNIVEFCRRVFSVVLYMGIIVYLLSHTALNFVYTDNMKHSILFMISKILTPIFAPIGLNNAGIVSALIVGIFAKELIVSTLSILNGATANNELISSLIFGGAVVLNRASAVSFLMFSLLYCPCVSTLAVIKKETGKFNFYFTLITEFVVAYLVCLLTYGMLTKGFVFTLIEAFIIAIIFVSIVFVIKKVKRKNLTCLKCSNRN